MHTCTHPPCAPPPCARPGVAWDPHLCFPALSEVYPDAPESQVLAAVKRLAEALGAEVARARGVKAEVGVGKLR